ncbi:MAG: hypothetical protein KDD25_03000 [Bdellovibrionales bacterium]|nr:hypothetical protein [Bdellovibrionales bacterium]
MTRRSRILLIFSLLTTFNFATAYDQNEIEGLRVYRSLTGKNLTRFDQNFATVIELAKNQKFEDIADLATEDSGFYLNRVFNWATLIYNSDESPYVAVNDAIVTLVGSVKDNRDARELLTGDYLYVPDPRIRPEASLRNNEGYIRLNQLHLDWHNYIKYRTPQWPIQGYEEAAGVLTTRGWAEKSYLATNRIAVKRSLQSFLCLSNDEWKTANLPTERIRQDVDRAPAGDPVEFQTNCRSCHSPMDGLAGAFSQMKFESNTFLRFTRVIPEYLRNSNVYPEGHVTTNDAFINYLVSGKNHRIGWEGNPSEPIVGRGVHEYGEMLVSSNAFAKCMVKRTVNSVCGLEKLSENRLNQLASEFRAKNYALKDLFKSVSISQVCKD